MSNERVPRVGHGFDLHRLVPDRKLVLCHTEVPYELGCDAHSDGDVALHALTDALLGAIGQEDIGQLFPDDDPRWRGADSAVFLREAVQRVADAGYGLGNADLTLVLQRPKLSPFKPTMRRRLAELLGCSPDRVNLKTKTHEGVDAIGEGRAVACHAVVMLIPSAGPGPQ